MAEIRRARYAVPLCGPMVLLRGGKRCPRALACVPVVEILKSTIIRPATHKGTRKTMRLASALTRSVIFALLWVTLTGGEADALIYGGLAVAAATLLSLRLYPADQPGIVLWRVAAFLPRFLTDAFMGGLDVARRALDPRLPIAPGWVRAELTNRNEAAGVLLGGVVSILPGSVAAGPGDAAMDVHLLNVTGYSADRMQADERRVLGLFDRRIGSLDAANG